MRQEDRELAERTLTTFRLRARASAISHDDDKVFVGLVAEAIRETREDEREVCDAVLNARDMVEYQDPEAIALIAREAAHKIVECDAELKGGDRAHSAACNKATATIKLTIACVSDE